MWFKKMLIPLRERRTKANFFYLTLMEILDTEVKIDLPRLVIKHLHHVFLKDDKWYALPYSFWIAPVFEEYSVLVQVWSLQTTKDVIGIVNYVALPASMRRADNPLQRLRNTLTDKIVKLEVVCIAHEVERVTLISHIHVLEADLARERADNVETIYKLTQLLPSAPSSSSSCPRMLIFVCPSHFILCS